jgi:HSP20 family protein
MRFILNRARLETIIDTARPELADVYEQSFVEHDTLLVNVLTMMKAPVSPNPPRVVAQERPGFFSHSRSQMAGFYSHMEAQMKLSSLIPIGRERNIARAYNPFLSLQRDVENLFEDFTRGWPALTADAPASGLVPSTDVVESDKEIQITAELPGLEEKDIQVNVADNVLTIKGEKTAQKEEKDKNYRLVERSYGSFSRSIELPAGVDPGVIKASISKGVLTVVIPKPAPMQVKKIDVKAAA